MKNKKNAQNHKVWHNYSNFTNKNTVAWRNFNLNSKPHTGNKELKLKCNFSTTFLLFDKTKIKSDTCTMEKKEGLNV